MDISHFPNISSYKDRHGKVRWRFRRRGFRTHHFQATPDQPVFQAEYDWARQQKPELKLEKSVVGYRTATRRLRGLELVYFIGPRNGPVKIGRTRSIDERLKKLQTGYHRRLYLLAVMPGGEALEAELHNRFAAHRLAGEWFERSSELVGLMSENRPHEWRTDLAL